MSQNIFFFFYKHDMKKFQLNITNEYEAISQLAYDIQ